MTVVVKRRSIVPKTVKTTQGEITEMTPEGDDPTLPPGVTINLNEPSQQRPVPIELSAELQAIIDQRVEAVRKEEKDKLYPEMERQKALIEELAAEKEARETALLEQQQAAAAAEEERRLAELSVVERLEDQGKRWEAQFEQMRQERDREAALREREAEYAALELHRGQVIAANQDLIEPRLIPYIRGNTPEEIDAAVARAIEDTNAIANDFQEAMGTQRRQVPLPVSGMPSDPVASLLNNPSDRTTTLSVEDLRNMSPDDYAANRQQILAAASQRGPYG